MVVHVVIIANTACIALGANQFLPAAFRLDTVMTFLPDLAVGTSLTSPLDYRQHLRHPQVTQQVRLIVIGLLWDTGRCERVLNHHDYKMTSKTVLKLRCIIHNNYMIVLL